MYIEESSDIEAASPEFDDAVEAELPLTPVQEELIFKIAHSHDPETIEFQLYLPDRVYSSFDLLQHTWQAVASHNPVLRTQVDLSDTLTSPAKGKQRVLKRVSLLQLFRPVLSQKGRFHEAAQLVIKTHNQQLSASVHLHRALIDNESICLIRRDFELFHNGLAFVRHPRPERFFRRTCSRDREAAKLFWNVNLEGLVNTPIYGLPSNATAPDIWVTAAMGQDTSDQVQTLATRCKVPVRTIFHAAWASTLAWHTAAANNYIVFTVTGRDLSIPQNRFVVGNADQFYPLKVAPAQESLISSWLNAINNADIEASSFAFIGYDSILAEGFASIGQTLVTIRSNKDNPTKNFQTYSENFALILEIVASDEITLTLHYSQEFPESRARVLLNHFEEAISSLSNDKVQKVQDVSLISPSERRYLLDLAQPTTEPAGGLVHQLFETQVRKTPNAPAAQFESDNPLSYLELNKLANAVARQLRCGRGSFVPVCMHRSINLVVSLLAIVKTGAAYVTLDPDVPAQRNEFMFWDVGAPFALVDQASRGTLPVEIVIENLVERACYQDNSDLLIEQSYDDAVYVIYTSGSTGHPKGVPHKHRAAYSGLAAFPSIPDLRQLLFHNPVFSAAQRSVWSTLKQGGCLCLASKKNLTVFIENTINSMEINTIDVTPSTATLITPGSVPNLKRMTVAGELINLALVPVWIDRLELMNAYGLSENTQFNWRHVIKKGQNPQNIGRPTDTTTAYVLCPGTTLLAPLLVPGELCLGGHQLSQGYLNRPEKTREVFINNPFGLGKLYRTGDLVITHADGSIEMVGRIDFSIKINDQRVDPGESNSIIQLQPYVRDSAVVAASISGRRRLVAVVVLKDDAPHTSPLTVLRKQLEEQLPHYIVPTYWITCTELPLNVNGKVDVPALRKICEDLGRSGVMQKQNESADPESETLSPVEETFKGLWSLALSIPPDEISKTDSFLAIGGNSLDAIKICSAGLEVGLRIDPAHLLQGYSVSQLAHENALQSDAELASTPKPFSLAPKNFSINFDEVEDVFPATPLQEGLIADSILGKTDYMFRKAFSFKGVPLSRLRDAFEVVVKENQLLRTVFVAHGISFLQVIQKHIALSWSNIDMDLDTYLNQERHNVEFVALDTPLLRITILKSSVMVVDTHHALFDFWSTQFLFEDIRAVLKGQKHIVRPPFSIFCQYLDSQDKTVSRQFWKTYLEGAKQTSLKTVAGEGFYLEADLDVDLKSAVSKNKLTAGALLYAAWAITLSAWISSNDVVFVVNISGREVPIKGILALNGPTLATVPMRVKIEDSADVLELAWALIPEFWKLAKHAHVGLRNVLQASGLPPSFINSASNFLVTLRQDEECDVLQPLDIKRGNHTDYLTLEMEDRNPRRLKVFSNRRFTNADEILEDVTEVLRVAVEEPQTKISDVLLRIGPHQSRLPKPTPAKMPQTNDLRKPISAKIVQPDDQPTQVMHDSWRNYVADSAPSVLVNCPRERQSTIKEFSSVDVETAAARLGVSQEALWYTSWGVVLAQHTNTQIPLFGVVHLDGNISSKHGKPSLRLIPQRVTIPGAQDSLSGVVRSVDRDLCNKTESCGSRIEQASEFASKHSNPFDTFLGLNIANFENESLIAELDSYGKTMDSSNTLLRIDCQPLKTTMTICSKMEKIRAEFILEQIFTMIKVLVEDPELPAGSVIVIGGTERNLLHTLAGFTTPKVHLVHSLFEKHARETPDRLVLQWESSESLTYKALNDRANQLARYLISMGAIPRQMIPLLLDKSICTIISILAVLKTGAAYVPMDPENPAERNLFILDQVQAKIVVTHSSYTDFANLHGLTSVFVDQLPHLDSISTADTHIGHVDNLAYCIYTSGSTGVPKGVNIQHRTISVAVDGMIIDEGMQPDWRFLSFANYVFDVSVHDIFCVLSTGATLCMASSDRLKSDLAGVINETKATQTFLTPTVARLISPADVPGLQTLMCSGEAMTADIIRSWASERTLINYYGPTECAVNVTIKNVGPDTSPTNLGKPVRTASAMIVERAGTELAVYGAIGEICIGGGHVGQGYMNREDLTAKVFVPSPIPSVGRMYRTGDLGRWLPGGDLEYLGRMDHQIKLNGHRIELGEIEQTILRSGLVQDCVAMVLDKLSRPQLAVFCIFETSTEATIEETSNYTSKLLQLKGSLGSLAHYMVPKIVFPMGRFPRSSANKTDRKGLKRLVEALDTSKLSQYSLDVVGAEVETFKSPISAEETFLQNEWSELFQIDKSEIGAEANFFILGGDSIAAINLVSVCRKSNYNLLVSDILKLATLGRIATRLSKKSLRVNGTLKPVDQYKPPSAIHELLQTQAIKQGSIEYFYPVPPGQAEFLTQGAKESQIWVVTAGRPFPAHHSIEAYRNLIQELTRTNDILRTTFVNLPGHGWVGVVLKEPVVDFSTRECVLAQRSQIVDEIQNSRFVFGEPFISYNLLKYSNSPWEIVIKMDHGLWDGTSLRIFDDAILTLQNSGIPPSNTPFKDFVFDQWLRPKSPSLSFWKDHLTNKKTPWPHATNPSTTALLSTPIPPTLAIDALATACAVTPAIIFQAAFQLWLAEASGIPEASYDYLVTGRNVALPAPQTIAGCCANFLPFRAAVDRDEPLAAFLTQTQDFFWQATEHANVSLSDIYGAAGLEREEVGNRCLFLFQPFEPATGPLKTEMRWVVLGLSKASMKQGYAFVVEVHRGVEGYRIVCKFDEGVFGRWEVERGVGRVRLGKILGGGVGLVEDGRWVGI